MGSMNNWLGFSSFSGADAVLHPSPQEWGGMKGVMAAADEEQPKLEDFLGMQEQPAEAGRSGAGSGVGATSIGLSMIKNWLRSQPAPAVGGDLMALSMSSPTDAEAGTGASPDGRGKVADGAVVEAAPRKAVDTFGQRTSIYRGVTKHRWTGRYEAHLWDNSCRREGQTRKGRQVYLGGYDKEDKAARAYDLAALKYWGTTTTTNFPVSDYGKELEEMKHMTRQEYVASLRRKSSGFSRGASIYRGVTRHHQHGRWQARIGRVAGNKDLYLGTFSTQEEAAEAYDIAAIKFRGLSAVTNFDMSRYDVKSIIESSTLPMSGTAKRLKDVSEHNDMGMDVNGTNADSVATSQLTDGIGSYGSHHFGYTGWSPIAMQPIPLQYASGQSSMWCKQEQDSAAVAAAQNLHSLHHFPAVRRTQNFFQPSPAPDVMSVVEVPSPSLDSNSFMYNGGIGYHGAVGAGIYGMPVATLVDQGQGNHASSGYGDDGVVVGGTASDLYGSRDMYYLSQDSPGADVGRDDSYEQGAAGCNSWVSTAPVMAEKANVTVCHGAPLFPAWNDA